MENIVFSNKENFESLKNIFTSEGIKKIHILADFDNTLTRAYDNGVRRPGILNIIREHGLLGDEFIKKSEELFKKYYPMEIDHSLPLKEIIPYMHEWWKKTFELLIDYGLTKEHVKYAGESNYAILRENFDNFFKIINENNIPMVVMTAGVYDMVYEFLNNNLKDLKNIDVVANEMIWDESGKLKGYKEPIIHVYNKSETVTSNYPEIHKKIEKRKNVILLGDSLGDHHMIEGFDYDHLLNIGFLNDDKPGLLDEFLKRYDIVITGDGSMDFVSDFLKECF